METNQEILSPLPCGIRIQALPFIVLPVKFHCLNIDATSIYCLYKSNPILAPCGSWMSIRWAVTIIRDCLYTKEEKRAARSTDSRASWWITDSCWFLNGSRNEKNHSHTIWHSVVLVFLLNKTLQKYWSALVFFPFYFPIIFGEIYRPNVRSKQQQQKPQIIYKLWIPKYHFH